MSRKGSSTGAFRTAAMLVALALLLPVILLLLQTTAISLTVKGPPPGDKTIAVVVVSQVGTSGRRSSLIPAVQLREQTA